MKNLIKKLLRESLIKENDDIDWDLYDLLFEIKNQIMGDYLTAIETEKPDDDTPLQARQKMTVIPFSALRRQWQEYMKYGYVKPNYENTILSFEKIFTENTLIMRVNTELAGHSTVSPINKWKEFLEGTEYDNENLDEFIDYLDEHFGDYILDEKGQFKISDYGLPKLEALIVELRKTHDVNKKLPILDKMLNVIHMRSDIAEWFVEGGSNSLDDLAIN